MSDKSMLDKVVEATEQLREALTEGRALLKDLRHERKQVEKLLADIKPVLTKEVDDHISEVLEPELARQLDVMTTDILKAKDTAERKIKLSFDQLANILLYGNKQGRERSLVREHIERGFAPFQSDPNGPSTAEALEDLDEVEKQ